MIISILGTSGAFFNPDNCTPRRDEKGKILFQHARYNSDIFDIPSQAYHNSTQFLLENFEDTFVFIGTECAISFQKTILNQSLKGKTVEYVPIEDNSLDDIFEKILELLTHHDNIILDITHGFRHQPIMAIFASTLSQFLERRDLKIVFAKEVVQYKEYEYIYLDEYIEITQISLLLTGFIRTFNFIPVKSMKLLNNTLFEDFSESLLSNDLRGIEKNYQLLSDELKRLQKNEELKHIFQLLEKVRTELEPLGMFPFLKHYQKYMILSQLTIEKNYLIVALTYIFESLREYCTFRFQPLCQNIKFKDSYEHNTAVMNSITNFTKSKFRNKIFETYPKIYDHNKSEFKRIAKLYKRVRDLRNDLAHINKTNDFADIKKDLYQIIFQVETLYKDEVLATIKP